MATEETIQAEKTAGADSEKQTRERSTIVFPYGDLNDAVQVAKAVHGLDGMAEMDQIANSLDHENVDSGAFRLKITAARVFGLIKVKGEQASLTDLGNQIVRTDTEAKARALAFMEVPLYRAIYENYKGKLLPGDAALEAEMVELGVAPKQKGRARQGFQRSAEQAKLGKDRLVLPGGVSLDQPPREKGNGQSMETGQQPILPPTSNAFLAPLISVLPQPGSEWSREARDQWLTILKATFDLMYKDKAE